MRPERKTKVENDGEKMDWQSRQRSSGNERRQGREAARSGLLVVVVVVSFIGCVPFADPSVPLDLISPVLSLFFCFVLFCGFFFEKPQLQIAKAEKEKEMLEVLLPAKSPRLSGDIWGIELRDKQRSQL